MDLSEAQIIVEAERNRRAQEAAAAVQAVLSERRCDIVAVISITVDGRLVATTQIVAR